MSVGSESRDQQRTAKMLRGCKQVAAALAVWQAAGLLAFAAATDRWEFQSAEDFLKGELDGLIVTSDGTLRLGYHAESVGELAKEVWSSLADAQGQVYLGTGSPAKVHRIDAAGQLTELWADDVVAVTALALDRRGRLYMATLADGKIFRLDPAAPDKAELFCQLPETYIWATLFDAADNLFVATGPAGKLYRVSPAGEVAEWYTATDAHLLCLAFDADGAVLAGGSDRGRLYRITAAGTATVRHQFADSEVKALAVAGGEIHVGVNRPKPRPGRPPVAIPTLPRVDAAPTPAPEGDSPAPPGEDRATPPTPAEARDRIVLPPERPTPAMAGAVHRIDAAGRVEELTSWTDESVLALAPAAAGDGVWVATAGKARVYRVRDVQQRELVFDFPAQQALTLTARDGRLAFVGTGNVGRGYVISAEPVAAGTFTSPALDARFPTQWGNVFWRGGGGVRVSARSGQTTPPDDTWADWAAPVETSPGKLTSPVARFLQVRVELHGNDDPRLQQLRVFYQAQNQRPEITQFQVNDTAGNRAGDKDSDKAPRPARSVTASTKKNLTWQARDPDGDELVYRLYYRPEGAAVWIAVPLERPLDKPAFTWETESIPDGWHEVKLEASDETANPVGQRLTAERVRDGILIDNRRPELLELRFDRATNTASGRARDRISPITRIEYAVDGGEWRAVAPADGIFDSLEEAFAFQPELPAAGGHYLAVRATDAAGNIGVEQVELR